MESYQQIGQRIKEMRVKHGVSQNSMAEDIGISRSLLAQIERSNTKPTLEILYKLVRYFNTTYDYLIEGIELPSGRDTLKYLNVRPKEVDPYVFTEEEAKGIILHEPNSEFKGRKQKESKPSIEDLQKQMDSILKRLDRNNIK